MNPEIRLPDREPIQNWRMALVVTRANEIVVDRNGLDDTEAAEILRQIAAMLLERQG